MYLTDYEQEMLAGKYGAAQAMALKVQVAVGECFGAKRLLEVSRVHVASSNQEADVWFAEKLLKMGGRCLVSPTVNPGFNLSYLGQHLSISKEDADLMERARRAYRELGAIMTLSCTPYLETNVPRFGEILSYSETSVTVYVNSVIGARTNREAVQSSLCAAITGRVPEYGFLLDENRKGTVLVQLEADIKSDFDYQLLGSCTQKIGAGVPVFVGLPQNPSQEGLINLGTQLNTTGSYAMFHIPGVTPEAPTLNDALGGKKPERVVTITNEDLENIHKQVSQSPGRIDFAMFGCPHFTFSQVQEVARLVQGKKLNAEMWVLTSSLNKELARRTGMLEAIEEAGGHIVEDTCIDQPCWSHLNGKVGVTDSPKCAYYAKMRGMNFIIRDLKTCVEAAVKGEVS
jgi:predicted aconitase